MGFKPPQAAQSGSVASLGPALDPIKQASNGAWPARPTIGGVAPTWPMLWQSYPGNTTPPPDGAMAAMDEYIPVPT